MNGSSRPGHNSGNSRNGTIAKKVQTGIGPIGLEVPRDRAGSFEPVLIPKRSGRVSGGLDDMIISMYAHSMTVRDILHHLEQVYEVVAFGAQGGDLVAGEFQVGAQAGGAGGEPGAVAGRWLGGLPFDGGVVLLGRSSASKDAELLVLRHEVAVRAVPVRGPGSTGPTARSSPRSSGSCRPGCGCAGWSPQAPSCAGTAA